jgi:hypothetical protein
MSRAGAAFAGLCLAIAPAAFGLSAAEQRLLADTNLFATAPQELRARLAIASPPSTAKLAVEIWRGGRDRLLVRPLDPRQRGKFFLQLGAERWFFAPGARQPVRLSSSLRLAGGISFEEILGIDLERGYTLTGVETVRDVVTFHLAANAETAKASGYAGARWVVDARARRPLRVDLLLADGRIARIVEFSAFRSTRPLVPGRVVLKEPLRGTGPLVVEILELEARPAPPGLFDLADGSARAKLLASP